MTEQLLVCLQARANARGLVLAQEPALLRELQITHDVLASALAVLERDGSVEVLSRLPFLAVKLKKWSGRATKSANSGASGYSYSTLSLSKHVMHSYRHDKALLREILETLGETDATSFAGAIANFPADVIRKALDRVRRTRAVRKNRTALFRYLLTRLT
jgi:hypothetical protein